MPNQVEHWVWRVGTLGGSIHPPAEGEELVRRSDYERLEVKAMNDEAVAIRRAIQAEAERDQALADAKGWMDETLAATESERDAPRKQALLEVAAGFERWAQQQEMLEKHSDLEGVALLRDAYRSAAYHRRELAEKESSGGVIPNP